MTDTARPFAMVTGASSGIGYELAKVAAEYGYDLLIAADEAAIEEAADALRAYGVTVTSVVCDLATREGVSALGDAALGRQVDVLLANAGHGLGRAFLDQDFDEIEHVIDTNITGTIDLIQHIGREMRARGQGRILITGSVAGYVPGAFSAVYNGTKAFIDSFSFALRSELKDTGVTVTCLIPGATDTAFFERADMLDTKLGQEEKDDPADVARAGFEAMLHGDADIVSGWRNKLQTVMASVLPSDVTAEQYRRIAEPGSGKKD